MLHLKKINLWGLLNKSVVCILAVIHCQSCCVLSEEKLNILTRTFTMINTVTASNIKYKICRL